MQTMGNYQVPSSRTLPFSSMIGKSFITPSMISKLQVTYPLLIFNLIEFQGVLTIPIVSKSLNMIGEFSCKYLVMILLNYY
jgi:hypothetical protein